MIPLRIRSWTNFDLVDDKPEVHVKPSQTTPDMSYTPQELLRRYAQGLPIDKLGNHFYSGEQDLPDMRTLDLTEQVEVIQAAVDNVKRQEDEFNRKSALRKKQREDWLKQKAANDVLLKSAADKLAAASSATKH